MSESPQEMADNSLQRVERMLEVAREAEYDEARIPDLRTEIKKWVTTLKPDVLAQYALHMVGDGRRIAHDLQQKVSRAGDALDEDIKDRLDRQLEETDRRIGQIADLSLKSERHSRTAEQLRDEVKKWVDNLPLPTLLHFASHYIGTGTVFVKYVQELDRMGF
tara:strand:- start:1693 stop:2181 length:489 start_codon:yes stop_codon:yes gene_type:complete